MKKISNIIQKSNSLMNKNYFTFLSQNTNRTMNENTFKNSNFLIQQFKKNFSGVYVNHRDTDSNNEQAPFDFTEENYKQVDEIMVRKIFDNHNFLLI